MWRYRKCGSSPTRAACEVDLFILLSNVRILPQELGLYKSLVRLPFNAFGTMAMARDVSGKGSVYWSCVVLLLRMRHFMT